MGSRARAGHPWSRRSSRHRACRPGRTRCSWCMIAGACIETTTTTTTVRENRRTARQPTSQDAPPVAHVGLPVDGEEIRVPKARIIARLVAGVRLRSAGGGAQAASDGHDADGDGLGTKLVVGQEDVARVRSGRGRRRGARDDGLGRGLRGRDDGLPCACVVAMFHRGVGSWG